MAISIIDGLEIVHIDYIKRVQPGLRVRTFQKFLYPRFQCAPVPEAGQRVVLRFVLQIKLLAFLYIYIRDESEAGQRAGRRVTLHVHGDLPPCGRMAISGHGAVFEQEDPAFFIVLAQIEQRKRAEKFRPLAGENGLACELR